MGIPLDTPSVQTGPQWAVDAEAGKLIIDAHTHTSGAGVPVPTAGLNINANLPMGGFGLTNAGPLALTNQLTTSSGTTNYLYTVGGNLYWNQGAGVPIQLTTSTGINVASVGGISGLAGTTGAWTYSSALTTFIGTADTNKSAAVDVGAVTIRETNVANAQGIRLESPTNLTGGYTVTLPPALPTTGSGVAVLGSTGGLGFVRTPSTSGVLLVDTAGRVDVGRVSVSGLLNCNQFYVYGSTSAQKTGIPVQGFATMFADSVVKDTAGGWSTANGWYTIPADGDWMLGWSVGGFTTVGSGGFLQSFLVINSGSGGVSVGGASAKMTVAAAGGTTRAFHLPGTFMYPNAKVGDRIKYGLMWDDAAIHTPSSATATMVATSGYNYFHGYQLR